MLFQHVARNELGRDFAVGDIHGCFDLLREAMARVGFNEDIDRLFSVGDLVDRGAHSHEAVDWLLYPWFYAVRGNHEQLAIESEAGQSNSALHVINGGLWFHALDTAERRRTARAFAELPYAIELDTAGGAVGFVHAEVPGDDWAYFRALLKSAEVQKPANFEHVERFALWGRDIIRARSTFDGVANIERVYVGHTALVDWRALGNVHYIDTGAVYGRSLTMVCLNDSAVTQVGG